jgi:hypothetical protein
VPTKHSARQWFVVIVLVVLALFLYFGLSGRPAKLKPEDEPPTEQLPPSA